MTREDIILMVQEAVIGSPIDENPFDFRLVKMETIECFAALVAAEKDKEIKRLQDMLYEQLGELTALRAEKQMRERIKEINEQPR